MGIKDEFHQKAILICVEELCTSQGIQAEDNSVINTDPYIASVSEKYRHNLMEHSFSSLKKCDKCKKYLRGLLHQGFICQGWYIQSNSYLLHDMRLNALIIFVIITDVRQRNLEQFANCLN